jgi:LysM repeat protein
VADRIVEKPIAIVTLPEVPENVLDHVVEKGQSLYSISKQYGVSIAELKKINGLTSDQLSINQKLWIPKNEVTAKVAAVDANPVVAETQAEVKEVVAQPMDTMAKTAGVSIKDSMALQGGMPEQVPAKIKSSSLKEYEKKVTAQIGYEGMKADRSWVMINKHKKGEVIAVINPANKKMVYCTVIGELPEKKGGKQIAISQSVADRLGITEANATLRVRYVAQ